MNALMIDIGHPKAQEAVVSCDPKQFYEAVELNRQGHLTFWQAGDSVAGVQWGDGIAALCFYHRNGRASGLMSEARSILKAVTAEMRTRGVERMYAEVSTENPRYAKLVRFYQRHFGLKPDALRMQTSRAALEGV